METEMEIDSLSFYERLSPLSPSPRLKDHSGLSYYYPARADDGFQIPAEQPVATMDSPWPALPPPREKVVRRSNHSKIRTAGGMRDRRMRLPLGVARRFFALQDKLGFDQASKTVEWLLDLMATTSISEDRQVVLQHDEEMVMDSGAHDKRPKVSERAAPAPKKSNAHTTAVLQDKESRARARERARERTNEKNRLRSITTEEASTRQVEDEISAACFGHSSSYEQEPWELSGVVFAKARFH